MLSKSFLFIVLSICAMPCLAQIGFKSFQMDIEGRSSFDAEFGCMTDLNDDGLVDLICLAERNSNNFGLQEGRFLLTYLQNQDTFTVADTLWMSNRFYSAQAIRSADLMGDSLTEIVIAYGQFIEIFEYTSSGHFQFVDSIRFPSPVIDMQINDLYDDDTNRIMVVTAELITPGTLHIITPRANNDLHQWSTESLGFGTDRNDIGFGDFNNDGFEDVAIYGFDAAIASSGVAIWYGASSGLQTPYAFIPHQQIAPLGQSMATGDFNSDGLDDISILCRSNLVDTSFVVWFQDSAAGFEQKVFLGDGRTYHDDIVAGNFACGTQDDLVILAHFGFNNGYACYEQIDTGFLRTVSPPEVFLNSRGAGLQVVDVDNDGLDDLLRVGSGAIGIDFNTSDGLSRMDTLDAYESSDSIYVTQDTASYSFSQILSTDTLDSLVVTETEHYQNDSIFSDTSTFLFTQNIIQTKSCLVYSVDTTESVEVVYGSGFLSTLSSWLVRDTLILPTIPIEPIDTPFHVLTVRLGLYPNPTSGQLFFELNTSEPLLYDVKVFDTHGRIILTETTPSSIDLSSAAAGVYIVQVARFGVRQRIVVL